ncbi:hypothetical protein CALCODRAFT_445008 [Calocera cornea HHB12733]|uniref:Integrase core domain-containing protein n=1 Tax=Calocera cornea HHB12733 TaxID=1353952 RepID=A0A165C1E3_9BASI|nr:hypothetical protein CALCODRAFT_445008 [Calocera cornea HHB12733]
MRSKRTVSRRRMKLELKSVRQQGHTLESIRIHIEPIIRKFPNAGVKRIRDWLALKQIFVSEHLIRQYTNKYHAAEVRRRKGRKLKRKKLWSPGVFDSVAVDQHDKWQQYGLYLHLGVEMFSGALLWIEPWWTNKNPRLILSYYLKSARQHGGIPLLTQSDPGSENNGIANAQTTMHQRLDPSLEGKLQHCWMRGHANIKPEIKWMQLRREFTRAFEDLFAVGTNYGWYDKHNCLQNYIFRWLAIPFLKANLDEYMQMYNRSLPRADKTKVLPRGRPEHILYHPERFGNARNFKILVSEEDFRYVETLYAPPDHPVFELVPPYFDMEIKANFEVLGRPEVNMDSFWATYLRLLDAFMRSGTRDEIQRSLALQVEREMSIENEYMDLLEGTEPERRAYCDVWQDGEGVVEEDWSGDSTDDGWSEGEEDRGDLMREVEDLTTRMIG